MKTNRLGKTGLQVSEIGFGGEWLERHPEEESIELIRYASSKGINILDCWMPDPKSRNIIGEGIKENRGQWFIQGHIGSTWKDEQYYRTRDMKYVRPAFEDLLKRLQTDYLDLLLLHRPDALVEPEEVAAAFDVLFESGKVRHFGVSNHKPMQIALLQKYVRQPLVVNQVQFSIPVSNLVANGMEVNMETPGSVDHDGSLLDYCRLHDITLQAWSPFQMPSWKGCFLGSDEYPELNQKIRVLAEKYGVSDTTIAAAWILRHPANMQLVTGTASEKRLKEIIAACNITLTREEWYELYLAAGHPLP